MGKDMVFLIMGLILNSIKIQHPGCEEKIELAIAVIQNMKVVEDTANLYLRNIRCKVLPE